MLADEIRTWDPQGPAKAREEHQRLEIAARDLSQTLARADAEKRTLAAQLAQISGGVCPFLKEKCRQFDRRKRWKAAWAPATWSWRN